MIHIFPYPTLKGFKIVKSTYAFILIKQQNHIAYFQDWNIWCCICYYCYKLHGDKVQ